ncbi:MAG: hypothetical protein RLZZ200_3063 [Pseudomonadota bacterium]
MAVTESFARKLAARLGSSDPTALKAFLDQWQPFEGGSPDNPLNTTQGAPGAVKFNDAGVKRYPNEDVGVEATAQTLENGYYPNLLNAIKSGDFSNTAAFASEIAKWGTHGFAATLGWNGSEGDGGANFDASGWQLKYAAAYSQWKPLDDKYGQVEDLQQNGQEVRFDPDRGWTVGDVMGYDASGSLVVAKPGRVLMTPQEYQQYSSLSGQLADLEGEYQNAGGDLDTAIKRATWNYNTDPRNIDAQNASAAFDREMQTRQQATSLANSRLAAVNDAQGTAIASMNEPRRAGQLQLAPSMDPPSSSDLFDQAVEDVKKGLPTVPPAPYFSASDRAFGSQGFAMLPDRAKEAAAAASGTNAPGQTMPPVGRVRIPAFGFGGGVAAGVPGLQSNAFQQSSYTDEHGNVIRHVNPVPPPLPGTGAGPRTVLSPTQNQSRPVLIDPTVANAGQPASPTGAISGSILSRASGGFGSLVRGAFGRAPVLTSTRGY